MRSEKQKRREVVRSHRRWWREYALNGHSAKEELLHEKWVAQTKALRDILVAKHSWCRACAIMSALSAAYPVTCAPNHDL